MIVKILEYKGWSWVDACRGDLEVTPMDPYYRGTGCSFFSVQCAAWAECQGCTLDKHRAVILPFNPKKAEWTEVYQADWNKPREIIGTQMGYVLHPAIVKAKIEPYRVSPLKYFILREFICDLDTVIAVREGA